jgi:hypothetical protein
VYRNIDGIEVMNADRPQHKIQINKNTKDRRHWLPSCSLLRAIRRQILRISVPKTHVVTANNGNTTKTTSRSLHRNAVISHISPYPRNHNPCHLSDFQIRNRPCCKHSPKHRPLSVETKNANESAEHSSKSSRRQTPAS